MHSAFGFQGAPRPGTAAACLALWLAIALTMPAGAATVVVRADGSGDVPTFQAGVDCLLGLGCDPPADTLVVEPGDYAEDVVFDFAANPGYGGTILCPGGPDATRVRSLAATPSTSGSCRVEGLQVTGDVAFGATFSGSHWVGCRFLGKVASRGTNVSYLGVYTIGAWFSHRFDDCDFRGGLTLRGAGILDRCRFTGTGARLELTMFSILVRDCVFEDIPDTAVVAKPGDGSSIGFRGCVFRSVGSGIVVDPAGVYSYDGVGVTRCHFEDVDDAAVSYESAAPGMSATFLVGVNDSRFERCGAGVRLLRDRPIRLEMRADTLIGVRGVGIEAAGILETCRLDSLIVRDGGAEGVVLRSSDAWDAFTVSHSIVENNVGGGIVIEHPLGEFGRRAAVTGCRLSGNGGAGARVAAVATVTDNLVVGNGGAGLDLAAFAALPDSVQRNTAAGNGGPGLALSAADPDSTPFAFVENNLATGNQGGGLVIAGALSGAAQRNHAWANGVADYLGADPALNPTLDPLYCDAPAGDYRVAANSACAPGGPYGQVGALGVGCAASPLPVGPFGSTSPLLALSGITPNPLSPGRAATVSFTLPDALPVSLEVLDAGGRRVARRDLGPLGPGHHHEPLRLEGRLAPGIYWVRVSQGARSAAGKVCVLR